METPVKRAFYDFSVAPYSYDFVNFLLCARAHNCTEVVFVPGVRYGTDANGNRFEYQKCTIEEQERRLHDMLIPLCTKAIICPTRESAKDLWHPGCFPPNYTVEEPTYAHMTAHVLCQKTIYPLIALPAIVEEVEQDVGPNPIVIPMRECPYRQIRNSNEPEWLKVAEWLEARGENVWFIPDTAVVDKVYPVAKTYKKAAVSIGHRLALTQIAKLTIGVNSGNMQFAFLSRRPMLYFNPIVEGSWEASAEMWERNYVPMGSQIPWFTNQQRIIWDGTDSFENIINALETWYAVGRGERQWPATIAPRFPLAGVVSNEDRSEHVRVAMQTGHPVLPAMKTFHDKSLSLVCFGPSLKDTWKDILHPIMTVSGAHDFLLDKGIVPDFHVACDPREEQLKFHMRPHPDCHYLMASCMDPGIWKLLEGMNVTIWHLHNGEGSEASIRKHDPTGELIEGGSTVGQRAMEVAARLGYRRFDIYGMDCSYAPDGERHAGTHPGKTQTAFKVEVANTGKSFMTSPQMKEPAEEFIRMLAGKPVILSGNQYMEYPDLTVRMHGEGLLQTMFAELEKRKRPAASQPIYRIIDGQLIAIASIGEGLSLGHLDKDRLNILKRRRVQHGR